MTTAECNNLFTSNITVLLFDENWMEMKLRDKLQWSSSYNSNTVHKQGLNEKYWTFNNSLFHEIKSTVRNIRKYNWLNIAVLHPPKCKFENLPWFHKISYKWNCNNFTVTLYSGQNWYFIQITIKIYNVDNVFPIWII